MSVQLRLRISLGVLVGGLLIVVFASALQFSDLAQSLERAGQEPELVQQLADKANTTAQGLALSGLLVLILGVSVSRMLRQHLLDRLATIDIAVTEIAHGDRTRRLILDGNDELSRIARTLDILLDQDDRREAELRGHNREVRALLVALLHQSPKPSAIIGIDGEIIVSTLSANAEEILRTLTPRVRSAAKILLSRGFVTASELSTEINTGLGHRVRVQALALGERRIVGWLAVFDEMPSTPIEPTPALEPEHEPEDESESEPRLEPLPDVP
jgi:methyl-accepting chemotaxis protein